MTTEAPSSESTVDDVVPPSRRIVRWVDGVSARIASVLERRPRSTRIMIACFMVIAITFALRHQARAAGMMQDEIQTAFNISNQFDIFNNAIDLAQYIFATLAALTVIVNVMAYYIRNQTIRGLSQTILSSLLSLGLPFVIILIAPTVLPAISVVGLEITDIVTGNATSNVSNITGNANGVIPPATVEQSLTTIYNNTFGAGANIPALTPKYILDQGVNIAWPLVQHAQTAISANEGNGTGANGPGLNSPTRESNQMVIFFILGLAISIIGAFVFIAVELVLAYLQIYLVLPVAAFSLGFLGSPATRQFGSGYWVIVVQALLRFATIVFVIGFAMALAQLWTRDVGQFQFNPLTPGQPGTDSNVLKQAISAAAVTFSLLYIVRVLPSMFSAILTGMYVGAEGNQAEGQIGGMLQGRGGMGGAMLNRSGKFGNLPPGSSPTSRAAAPRPRVG